MFWHLTQNTKHHTYLACVTLFRINGYCVWKHIEWQKGNEHTNQMANSMHITLMWVIRKSSYVPFVYMEWPPSSVYNTKENAFSGLDFNVMCIWRLLVSFQYSLISVPHFIWFHNGHTVLLIWKWLKRNSVDHPKAIHSLHCSWSLLLLLLLS